MTSRKDTEKALHNQENLLPKTQLILVFGILALVLFVCFIDQNGVSVALPTIAEDLGATKTISWAGTSSLIANTVFSVLYGRLSDIFGRKAVFITACALLAVGDLLCGLAQTSGMLYVFRAVAGLAGGGITNLTMIIVSDIVTLEQRGNYQGILGACVGLGNTAGPFVAAGFVESTTWRAFFWLLAPLAAGCGVVSWYMLPSNKPSDKFSDSVRRIDWAGSLSSSIAIILLLVPISGGGLYFAWASPMVVSMLVIGILALGVFLVVESKFAKLPMMPLEIFRDRNIAILLVQSFCLGWNYQTFLYYLPQYYQTVRGWSAVKAASYMVPIVIAQATCSIVSGRYISWRKHYSEVLWSGFLMWTLGSGLSVLFDEDVHPAICVVALVLVGIGVGFTFQPTLVALQAHSPKPRRAVIISNRNFFRCLGGACGLAVSAAILQSTLRKQLPTELKYLAETPYHLPQVGVNQQGAVRHAYMLANRSVFIANVPVIGICVLGCLFVKDRGLQPPQDHESKGAKDSGTHPLVAQIEQKPKNDEKH